MRIVAGSAKGTRLAPVPAGVDTRPMTDRAREGIFSSLGPARTREAAVLDLFAGTGSMGIEALSRGAAHATFVERSRKAAALIGRNLELTRLAERGRVVTADVEAFLRRKDRPGAPFDLVFFDPPYALGTAGLERILEQLSHGWLDPEGDWTLVLARRDEDSMPVVPVHWSVAKRLRYGGSSIRLIREVP